MLATDIVVFYLVLRGLDTVEDDMTAFDDIQVRLAFPVPAEGSGGSPKATRYVVLLLAVSWDAS